MELGFNPQVSLERGAGDKQQLRQLSQRFEGLLMSQMFSSMRETVPEGGLVEQGFGQKTFQDMMDKQIASLSAEHQSMGLGDALYKHLVQGLGAQGTTLPRD
jgi:flagellar protein FlgJ